MVPVFLLSVAVNFSRWFELKLQEYEVDPPPMVNSNHSSDADADADADVDNSTDKIVVIGIAGTWLRYNQARMENLGAF